MKFIPVDNVPGRGARTADQQVAQKLTRQHLTEFMSMGDKYAKVDLNPGDYANSEVAYIALRASVKYADLPITVIRRGEDVYLMRNDMEE